jgi:hypothetical protein
MKSRFPCEVVRKEAMSVLRWLRKRVWVVVVVVMVRCDSRMCIMECLV